MRSVCLPLKLIRNALVVLLLSAGVMGVSYSGYTETTRISGKITAGDIDVIFSDIYIIEQSSLAACATKAEITESGKALDIRVENAFPGYRSKICYELRNNGTVPVVYQISHPGVDAFVRVAEGTGYIPGNGGSGRGEIEISVGEDAEEGCGHRINIELNFQQANVVR